MASESASDILADAIRSHGRDAALPREFVDALTTGIDGAIGRYKTALEAIISLDFKKTERGDDYYSGPDRFIQAWLIAYRTIYPEADASPIAAAVDAQLDPLKDELVGIGHKLAKELVIECCADGHEGYLCTMPVGHDGDHFATNEQESGDTPKGRVFARWPRVGARA